MSQWRRKTHLDLKQHSSEIRGTPCFPVTMSVKQWPNQTTNEFLSLNYSCEITIDSLGQWRQVNKGSGCIFCLRDGFLTGLATSTADASRSSLVAWRFYCLWLLSPCVEHLEVHATGAAGVHRMQECDILYADRHRNMFQILSRLYDLSPVQNECNPKILPWSAVLTLSMWRWGHLLIG